MQKQKPEALQGALAAFAPKLDHLLKKQGMSQSELGRQLKRRGHAVAPKTINNIVNAQHSAQIGNMASIADFFGVPLWVMLIPGLPLDMVEGESLLRLNKMIQDYIATEPENRQHAENIAAAWVNRRGR